MVKITQSDGTTVEFQVFNDPDGPDKRIKANHMDKPMFDGDEQPDQIVRINGAKMTIEEVSKQFGERVAAALDGRL